MFAQSSPRLLPEDFEIGPLADRLGGSRSQRLARAAAQRFLSGLAGGKVPASEILPERREELERSLQYYLDRRLQPARHRLGPFSELEDGSLRCRVRLFGGGPAQGAAPAAAPAAAPGSTAGELYLASADGKWYLSDFQVGLTALGAAAERRAEKFVPTEAP
jgi:hypothetical protein